MSDTPKATAKKEVSIDEQKLVISLPGQEPVIVSLPDVKAVLTHLALHGLSQKLGDTYAGVKGDWAEGRARLVDALERLKKGEWTKAREAGGPSTALVVEAIARLKGKDTSEVQEVWNGLGDEVKKGIRAKEDVKAMVATISAERAQARAAKAKEGSEDEDTALDVFA